MLPGSSDSFTQVVNHGESLMFRLASILLACFFFATVIQAADPLPGTSPLKWDGDIASRMIDGVDKFLLNELAKSAGTRGRYWQRNLASAEAYEKSVQPNRDRLAHILGVRDQRKSFDGLEFVASTAQPALVGSGKGYDVFSVRWPTIRDLHGEGLLLVPRKPNGTDIIAIPDADHSPEMIAGLVKGIPAEAQYARRLVENGCRVLVPTLLSRK